MDQCLFCQIVNNTIPATVIYDDADVLGFVDIAPQAPVHLIFVPKKHIASFDDAFPEHTETLIKVLAAVKKVADEQGLAASGYRVLTNVGPDAGQTVFHLHVHLLGGRPLGALTTPVRE